jgi:hypothetical protein
LRQYRISLHQKAAGTLVIRGRHEFDLTVAASG